MLILASHKMRLVRRLCLLLIRWRGLGILAGRSHLLDTLLLLLLRGRRYVRIALLATPFQGSVPLFGRARGPGCLILIHRFGEE